MLGRSIPCILYRRCTYLVVFSMLTGYVGYSLVVALQAKGSYSRGRHESKIALYTSFNSKGSQKYALFCIYSKIYRLKYTLLSLNCCRVCSSLYTALQLVFCAHLISFDLSLDLV